MPQKELKKGYFITLLSGESHLLESCSIHFVLAPLFKYGSKKKKKNREEKNKCLADAVTKKKKT